MNSKYKVLKYSSNKFENIDDLISIEEPLEISLKYKESDKWINQSLSITMRTPGDDEDLVRGFLYNEQIITNIGDIDSIESYGDKVGQYNIQNKILATLNNSKNINISKIKRDFLTNSSCGVCGKSSLDALEIIKKNKTNSSEPKIKKEVIVKSPDILREGQSEFSKTGGIHASGLFNSNGELVAVREDVGRHNALDKLIGCALKNNQIDPKTQFITCSGRLNFELVQKVLMTDIGIMIGVGAPTSLAIDLANKFDITLVGFVKRDSFNIYTNNKKVIVG
ncbi:formate dehydrogenase accessory sulfurtransferase FdhD [Candidatus Pelagibacter communis]|uniref:formate dehydrogenase accessory sulfurtransferase FdhD n=1 Tax=Pelagibacter ubique TaxID=198252 RepID=UPI00094DB440|nr:formate dehydrogenase accessory sulfurtransferase FdhD [Candidatus Pelagibacter ubique]